MFVREYEIENYADNCWQADSAYRETAPTQNGASDAHRKGNGNDDGVASYVEINLVLHQVLYANRGNRSEKQ